MNAAVSLFHLHGGIDVVRIICGLFFIPHVVGKFFEPAALGFFVAAGFRPAKAWMYLAGALEIGIALFLIIGVYVPFAAAVAAIHLVVAGLAVYRVSKGKWLWNIGGCEFPIFWAICCAVVATTEYST